LYLYNEAQSNTIYITANGTSYFNSGNVLIGTTTDNSVKLQINGLAGGPSLSSLTGMLRIGQSGATGFLNIGNIAGDSYAAWIQSSDGGGSSFPLALQPSGGNVLIGTTSDGGVNRVLSVERSQNAVSSVAMINPNTGNAASAQFIISANNSSGFYGAFSSTHATTNWAGRSVFGTNALGGGITISAHNSGQDIRFLTDSTSNIRMVVASNGNVLINTTDNPGATLHVNGTIRTGAPSGGTAVNWRLGTARGGTVTTNATVRVEIDGVLVDLVARYV
jgi:hypothetical protein